MGAGDALGGEYGRRTGAGTPARSNARAMPNPVSRVSSVSAGHRGDATPHGRSVNRGEVEGAGELRGHSQRVAWRRRSFAANKDIERLGRHVLLGEIRTIVLNAGGERRDDSGWTSAEAIRTLELSRNLMHPLWREIEREELDDDETIAIRVEGTKHRTQRSRTI